MSHDVWGGGGGKGAGLSVCSCACKTDDAKLENVAAVEFYKR